MSRVWKKFFYKLSGPVLTMLYTCAVVAVSIWAGAHVAPWVGGAILIVWIFFPVLGLLVRDMWRDAKREVEWENRDMMRTLKGKEYDF